jgi:hypothetical protein
MPDEKSQSLAESIKFQQTLLEKLALTDKKFSDAHVRDVDKQIEQYKNLKKQVEEYWKSNKLGNEEYLKSSIRVNEELHQLDKLYRDSAGFFQRQWIGVKDTIGGAFDSLTNKLGIDLKTAGTVGLIVWAAGVLDAQRVMANFARLSGEQFGDLKNKGKDAGESFYRGMTDQSVRMNLGSLLFVTDMMRQQFTETLFRQGAQLKAGELKPKEFGLELNKGQDELLKFGQAYGITSEQMAKHLYTFQDIFRTTTMRSVESIEKFIGIAQDLQVAPNRFLSLMNNLTQSFKLQKIGADELIDVYRRMYSLGMGVEVTETMTSTLVGAIANLQEDKLAGMIQATTGLRGKQVIDEMMKFYIPPTGKEEGSEVGTTMSRLTLLQNFFKKVGITDEFSGSKFTQQFLGLGKFEEGVNIFRALNEYMKGGITSQESLTEALKVLQKTTPARDQLINTVVNSMQLLVRYLYDIATSWIFKLPKYDASLIPDKNELIIQRDTETMSNLQKELALTNIEIQSEKSKYARMEDKDVDKPGVKTHLEDLNKKSVMHQQWIEYYKKKIDDLQKETEEEEKSRFYNLKGNKMPAYNYPDFNQKPPAESQTVVHELRLAPDARNIVALDKNIEISTQVFNTGRKYHGYYGPKGQ